MIIKDIFLGKVAYPACYPDQCPLCHHYSEIRTLKAGVASADEVQVIFHCGFTSCKSFFIGYYEKKYQELFFDSEGEPFELTLKGFKPAKALLFPVPESIKKISPSFVSIFEEAEQAKHLELIQIAGPGYRKAFEFLIKDYAKKLAPNAIKEIEKSFVGKVVNQYLKDNRIKELAARTIWLGNDEIHYLRIWEKHNLEDLIILIRLVINNINNDELYNHYKENMK